MTTLTMKALRIMGVICACTVGLVAQESRSTSRPESRAADPSAFSFIVPGSTYRIMMLPVPAKAFGGRTLWCATTEIPWDAYDPFVYLLDVDEGEKDLDGITRPSKPYVPPDRGLGHATYPVISVSIRGATAFAQWLSERSGGKFRIPTEAEFEVLALADAKGTHCVPIEMVGDYAWTGLNSAGVPHPVGTTKKSNAWGLFDLHGNVQEWCSTPDGKGVAMGGSYLDHPKHVAAKSRRLFERSWQSTDPNIPKSTWWLSDAPTVGFRVVADSIPTKIKVELPTKEKK